VSTIEDLRQLAQDFIAPEIRGIESRLAALEKKVDENDARAERRHTEVLNAIHQVTNYTSVLERLSRLEAKTETKQ